MGMFDSIYVPRKMPDGFQLTAAEGQDIKFVYFAHEAMYQTKGLDCKLDVYGVGDDSRLMKYSLIDESETPVFCDYTGMVEIYTNVPSGKEKPNEYIVSQPEPTKEVPVWRWVQYNLVFEKGILVDIKDGYEPFMHTICEYNRNITS